MYIPDGNCNLLWTSVHKLEICSMAKPGFAKYVAKLEVDVTKPTLPCVALRCRGRATSCATIRTPPSKECTSLGQISACSRTTSRALSASSTFATTAVMAL